jgi:3-methylcrotonyl-CoA carboxylase alpha subunit
VFEGAVGYSFLVPDPLARTDEAAAASGSLRAPMPGLVKLVRAVKGEAVTKGQPLLILEAMKMEHTIAAPADGVVEDVLYGVGDQVTDGAPLLTFKTAVTAE